MNYQKEEIDMDLEIEKIEMENMVKERLNLIYEQLVNLYEETIGRYKKREHDIYNPHIFRNITKEIFIDWIINNNPDLEKEIDDLKKELN